MFTNYYTYPHICTGYFYIILVGIKQERHMPLRSCSRALCIKQVNISQCKDSFTCPFNFVQSHTCFFGSISVLRFLIFYTNIFFFKENVYWLIIRQYTKFQLPAMSGIGKKVCAQWLVVCG